MLPKIKTIVYATGLGDEAARVFRWAMSLALRYDAKIVIVHALEPLGTTGKAMLENYLSPETLAGLRSEGHRRVLENVREKLHRFCLDEAPDPSACENHVAEVRVLEGFPSDVILAEAKRVSADLIVMGAHRHTAVGEIFLGSTAHRVLQRSPVPVFLVRLPKE